MTTSEIQFIRDGCVMQAHAAKMFIGSVRQSADVMAKLDDARAAHLAEVSREFAADLEAALKKFNDQLDLKRNAKAK